MKFYHFLLCLAAFSLFIRCQKEDLELKEDASLVFGHFYGECLGEQCIETFKLTSEALLEDSEDVYPTTNTAPIMGTYTSLDQALFDQVSGLETMLPSELFDQNEVVFGSPDAGDWGGYYLAYTDGEDDWWWIIDTQKESIPDYLHDLIDEIAEAISTINN